MSGGLMALGGFAEGFAAARRDRMDRQARKETADRLEAAYRDGLMRSGGGYGAGHPNTGSPGGLGAAGAPQGLPGTGTNGNALFGLIDKHEGAGNYDTLFGHSQNGGRFDGVRVSDMTLAELEQFANPSGAYGQWVKGQVGRVATPMGRHQIVGTTLRRTANAMGLSPDTKFTPQLQDSMANYLARQRLSGLSSPAAKRAALRAEWEGFKNVSDSALDAAIAHFEATGGGMPVRPRGIGPV